MKSKIFIVLSLTLLVNSAMAETTCGEIIIDDFEDGDISDWRMMYDIPDANKNITLSTLAANGSYSIRLWNGLIGYAVDFAKENIDTTMNNSYRYYNLSFWYYAESGCSYPGDHDFYISSDNSFEDWVACVLNTGVSMSCGSWNYISMSIADEFWWKDPGFSLDSGFLGSINLEIYPGNRVYYDDIKLIPKNPETNWTCTDWSRCYTNNTQYRTCFDACGTELDKPSESQSCICTPEWQCGTWNVCIGGIQTRTCTDINDCGTQTGQPLLQQACPLNPTATTVTVSPTTVNRNGKLNISSTISDDDGVSYAKFYILDSAGSSTSYYMVKSGDVYLYTYNVPSTALLGVYQTKVFVEDSKGEGSWFIGENFTVVRYIDVGFSTDKATYNQSETIRISGTTRDATEAFVSTKCQLKFKSGLWKETVNITSNGTFSYNKTISLLDPSGNWEIEVFCSNVQGDYGSEIKSLEVRAPVRYEYYNVVINSPVMGSIYYQGENVRTTANVKLSETSVSGATVFAIMPTGDRMQMEETANSVYSDIFTIPIDAETGNWNIVIRAIKDNYIGENTVNITVRQSVINLAILEPIIFSFVPGEIITIKVKATRSDGSLATGLILYVNTSTGNISMTELGNGVYQASYTVIELGVFDLSFSGIENLQYQQEVIDIHEPTLWDYLRIYWYVFLIGVIAVAMTSYPLLKKQAGVSKIKKLQAEKKKIQAQQKDLQAAYFKKNEVDRQTFDKRSQEYEEQLRKLDEEIKSAKKKK